jgi:hypothetical protein
MAKNGYPTICGNCSAKLCIKPLISHDIAEGNAATEIPLHISLVRSKFTKKCLLTLAALSRRKPDNLMWASHLAGCVALPLALKLGRDARTEIALAPDGTEQWHRIVLAETESRPAHSESQNHAEERWFVAFSSQCRWGPAD